MFANDDNEKTIKTYARLLQDIREGNDTHMVDIDHTGGQDDNAKMHNITIKKSQMDDGTHTANSHDATGSKKDLQKYLAKHYDDMATAKELHPEIYNIKEGNDTYTHHVTNLMTPERGDHPDEHAKWNAVKAKAKETGIKIARPRDQSRAESGTHYTFTGRDHEHVTHFMSKTVGFDPKTDKGNGL